MSEPTEPVTTTKRLELRQLGTDDADFILELLNDPAFLAQIGDKGVRTRDDAVAYLETGPFASYRRWGFGLWRTGLHDGTPIGICGLLRRDELEAPDIGFALLPNFRRQGYCREAATATLTLGWDRWGLDRILAITSPGNSASIGLLLGLGFRFDGDRVLSPDESPINMYSLPRPRTDRRASSGD